jgi:magnesium-protoporphyrin O-methyltransferase
MPCCTRYCAAETHFGKERAQGDLRDYQLKGAQGITRIMVEELKRLPLEGKQLLDVGGGIGIIGAELAASGLAGATMVEASPAYVEVAQAEMKPRFGSRPANFVLGDFALIADTVPAADLVTLDRVVCCYPDFDALLRAAAGRTRETLAFSYPRDRWYVRIGVAMENLLRRIKGKSFTVVVHPEKGMRSTLEQAGLKQSGRRETFSWAVDLYRRAEARPSVA